MARLPRSPVQRQAIARQKMNPGSAGGVQAIVAPVRERPVPQQAQRHVEVARFSVVDEMTVMTSGPHTVEHPGHLGYRFKANAAGLATTTFDVLLNGTPIGSTIAVLASTTRQSDRLPARAERGDEIQLDIVSAGLHEQAVVEVVIDGDVEVDVPPFSPLLVGGLVAWWDADAITGKSDGDAISQWDDSSGNARHGTQGTAGSRPTYKTNILNGLPVVRFDGGDVLDVAAFTHGTKFSVFAVVVFRTTAAGNQFIYEQSSDTSQRMYLWKRGSDGKLIFGYHDGSAFRDYTKTWSPAVDTPYLIDGETGPVNNTLGISGTTDTSTTRTGYPTSASKAAQIGRSPGTGSNWNGDIAELIVYNADVSSIDRDLLRDYLSAKWGVTL